MICGKENTYSYKNLLLKDFNYKIDFKDDKLKLPNLPFKMNIDFFDKNRYLMQLIWMCICILI